MIKTPKSKRFDNATKLKVNLETLRVISSRELTAVNGGASAGTPATGPRNSFDIACCPN